MACIEKVRKTHWERSFILIQVNPLYSFSESVIDKSDFLVATYNYLMRACYKVFDTDFIFERYSFFSIFHSDIFM